MSTSQTSVFLFVPFVAAGAFAALLVVYVVLMRRLRLAGGETALDQSASSRPPMAVYGRDFYSKFV